jgi:hypothetical protein
MANINPAGSAKFWFDGDTASSIDSGTPSTGTTNVTNNWVGSTNYWYRGTPQGYLQGGSGSVADSPENISLLETDGPVDPPAPRRSRAYAIIL